MTPLPPAQRTLPALLERGAARWADRTLLVSGDVRWTFADALVHARGYAGRLRAAGVQPGDRVALLCANRAEFLLVVLGCAWAGAVVVPVNTASRGDGLRHVLSNSGAVLVVAEPGPAEQVDALGMPATRWIVGGARDGWSPFPPAAEPAAPHPSGPGDLFAILYTSGTTGVSKGVCCPHAQYFWWGWHTARILGLCEGDVLMTTLPLFHTNALNTFFQALLHGLTLAVEPRFSASGYWDAVRRHDATVGYLLGAMVPILLSRPAAPNDHAHRMRIALAPGVPGQFQAQFTKRHGVGLLDGYGSTETNFVIADHADALRHGTMGHLQPGFHARVVDADDEPVPDGEPGELVLRADEPFTFASGYFAMADKTVEAWRNLWFHTGDRVVRDHDGAFRFLDRMKDAIRRRGENISAFEVEQVMLSHPAVAVAAVFPVRSELAEDEVAAALVLHPGEHLSPAALIEHCAPRLPYFAVPRFLEFTDALPSTENGKVRKFVLRERGITAGDVGSRGRRDRRGPLTRPPGFVDNATMPAQRDGVSKQQGGSASVTPVLTFGIFDQNDVTGRPVAQQYAERLKLAEFYDSNGFHCYHMSEHHATPLSTTPSPNVFLAAISQRTRRLRFGPLVYLLPIYNPLRLAEEICMLDHLSGGRFEFGVGRGASPHELEYMGVDPGRNREMYAEAYDVLRRALTEDTLDHQGEFWTFRDVPITFKPFQQPIPQMWYAAASPESVVWPAQNRVNVVCGGPPARVRATTDRYRAEHPGGGHAPLLGINRYVVVAPTDAEALAIGTRAWPTFFKHFRALWDLHGTEPVNAKLPPDFATVLSSGNAIVGSPATVRDAIGRQSEEAGTNYFVANFTFGDMGMDEVMRSVRLFAHEVLPAFAGTTLAAE